MFDDLPFGQVRVAVHQRTDGRGTGQYKAVAGGVDTDHGRYIHVAACRHANRYGDGNHHHANSHVRGQIGQHTGNNDDERIDKENGLAIHHRQQGTGEETHEAAFF